MRRGRGRGVVVALCGASGSGKSTVTRAVARAPGWVRLEEAFDRLHPRPRLEPATQADLRAVELELLAEEARRFREARKQTALGRSVVADTHFLDPVAYTAGLLVSGEASPATFLAVVARTRALIARGVLGLPDLTCYLVTSTDLRRRRASQDPARHPEPLRARHERIGRFDAKVVRSCLAEGAPGRVLGVRGVAPARAIAEHLRQTASRVDPLEDPAAASRRALTALLHHQVIRSALGGSGNLKRATLSPRPPR